MYDWHGQDLQLTLLKWTILRNCARCVVRELSLINANISKLQHKLTDVDWWCMGGTIFHQFKRFCWLYLLGTEWCSPNQHPIQSFKWVDLIGGNEVNQRSFWDPNQWGIWGWVWWLYLDLLDLVIPLNISLAYLNQEISTDMIWYVPYITEWMARYSLFGFHSIQRQTYHARHGHLGSPLASR